MSGNKSESRGIRGGLFVGPVLVLLGIGMLVWLGRIAALGKDSSDWPSVDGTVRAVETGIVVRDKTHQEFYGTVEYAYTVNGRDYVSDRVSFGRSNDFEVEKDSYSIGQRVRVFYDSGNPSRAVLRPGLFSQLSGLRWWGIGLLVFGVLTLLPGKSKRRNQKHSRLPS